MIEEICFPRSTVASCFYSKKIVSDVINIRLHDVFIEENHIASNKKEHPPMFLLKENGIPHSKKSVAMFSLDKGPSANNDHVGEQLPRNPLVSVPPE